eukprot:jgi/Mesen1/7427/ME000388S06648
MAYLDDAIRRSIARLAL